MDKSVEELKNSLLNSMPTLFLGAGFSREAVCKDTIMPTGDELKEELFVKFVLGNVSAEEEKQIRKYNLRKLCDCIDGLEGNNKVQRENFLTERLKGARPNEKGFHKLLLKYPWKRIYTVNIDDLVENIYESAHKTYTSIASRRDIPEHGEEMELIKLHGCVRNAKEGYIFSNKEYNILINQKVNLGLIEFTKEIYSSNDLIFVGASLDEPDLEYYLQLYEDMQFKRKKSRIFFIEPYPQYELRQRAKDLGAEIIQWNTEQFLEFVSGLNYRPDKLECSRLELNRNMIYRIRDDIKIFKEDYDSNIYQGFYCNWQDVFENWTFEYNVYLGAQKVLNELLQISSKTRCFCVFGGSFAGKSTLIKQLGHYLYSLNYEVLEYKGKYLNREVVTNYIIESNYEKYVLLIDNAGFYYPVIEQMLKTDYAGKEVLILCASRTYYHKKKRYYLEGNCFREYFCVDLIKQKDADTIYKVLDSKNSLGYLYDLKETERIPEIARKKTVLNLLVDLTYGKGIREKIKKEMYFVKDLSEREKQLLLEVAIFGCADIEYYPLELFVERYGKTISLFDPRDIEKLRVSDYIKYDEQGISLRNTLFQEEILRVERKEIYDTVKGLLMWIAKNVHEGQHDIWTIIFQSLCNEKQLKKVFGFSQSQIHNLLQAMNDKYEKISYYWLQRGLFEQSKGDYSKAYSHLKKSQSIQPRSFMIQHAIARNYMKFANSQENISLAKPLFEKGEMLMKQLINSNEYYIEKAKPFSVDSFVLEKVRYIERFDIKVSVKELCEMRDMLDKVYSETDSFILKPMQMFYQLLVKSGKQGLIRMDFDSPYFDIMKKGLDGQEDYSEDIY